MRCLHAISRGVRPPAQPRDRRYPADAETLEDRPRLDGAARLTDHGLSTNNWQLATGNRQLARDAHRHHHVQVVGAVERLDHARLRGAAQFAFGGEFRSINDGLLSNRTVALGPVFLPLPQVAAGLVCLVAFAGLLLLSRTEFGRALEATREDRDAVALVGIDRDRIFALGWGIGAATVGVAGVMLTTFYYVSPSVGLNFAVIAYVVVALGGFGSMLGALAAGLLVGLAESLTALVLEPSLKQVGIFALYLLVLVVRPRGLFGKL